METRFSLTRDRRIRIELLPGERALLARVVLGLDTLEADRADPGYARLHPPVYLGDDTASTEWWRLMGDQLEKARGDDRAVFDRVVIEPESVLTPEEARSFLRVVNQGRLVFAARHGIEVAEDMEDLDEDEDVALWFFSYVVDDLSTVLGGLLR
ncbi:MAG TPA: DUF2017 family protein [Acidimicrobiia bacterium]